MSKRRNIEDDARRTTGALPKRPTVAQLESMYRQRIPVTPRFPMPASRGDQRSSSVGDMFRIPPKPQINYTGRPLGDTDMQARLVGGILQQAAGGMPLAPLSPSMPSPAGGARGTASGGGGGGSMRGGGGMGSAANRAAINEAIKAMTEAATASQGRIGELYSGAGTQLADMAAQYAAAQQALGQGAGRTLGAFGVTGEQMNPMGMSAGDYLASQQGLLTGLSAAQQAQLEAQKAAYQLILADMLKAGG